MYNEILTETLLATVLWYTSYCNFPQIFFIEIKHEYLNFNLRYFYVIMNHESLPFANFNVFSILFSFCLLPVILCLMLSLITEVNVLVM